MSARSNSLKIRNLTAIIERFSILSEHNEVKMLLSFEMVYKLANISGIPKMQASALNWTEQCCVCKMDSLSITRWK